MNILSRLAGALAPASKPIVSSSPPQDKRSSFAPIPEEDDDDSPIVRPRLSLPIDDDDDESDLVPPLSSGLEEENLTIQSPELPLRAVSEQPGRLSGRSFGGARDSDVFDPNDFTGDIGRQSDFFPGSLLEDLQARANAGADRTFDRYDTMYLFSSFDMSR